MKDKLRIITIHSVKGGAGKTTLALFMAKLLAKRGHRTCLIDLDVPAPGIENAIRVRHVRQRLNDYMLQPVAAREPITLDDMLGDYADPDLTEGRLRVVCLERCGASEQKELMDQIRYEAHTGAVEPRMMEMLKEVEDAGFEYCLLDCHPGIFEISELLMQWLRSSRAAWTPVFVTLLDRPHLVSTLEELSYLQGGRRKRIGNPVVVINRAQGNQPSQTAITTDDLKMRARTDQVCPQENFDAWFGTAGIEEFWAVRDDAAMAQHLQIGASGVLAAQGDAVQDVNVVLDAIVRTFEEPHGGGR
jgi:cellulose biosynthesis protein BcsQ